MPLYEYKCHSCGKTFEVLQKFSDEPVKTHQECGGETERLISAPAFHLKGSGWYATDYAKSNGSTPAADGKTGDGKTGDGKTADGKTADGKTGDAKSGNNNSSESGSEKKASKEVSSDSGSSSGDSKPAASESKPAPAVSADSK